MTKLPKGFSFIGPPPYEHQLETFFFCKRKDSAGILLEPGLGKTRCAIDIARYRIQKQALNKVLVVCPTSVLILWKREIERFSEYSATVLYGTKEDRIYLLKENTKFFIINYEILYKLITELKKAKFKMLVFDESSRYIRNHLAKRTKASIALSDIATYKLILTGTPIANRPIDLWAQFRCLDGGETFYKNFYKFKNKHFFNVKRRRKNGGTWTESKLKNTSVHIISTLIENSCIRKRKIDCLDLPEQIFSVIELNLGKLAGIYQAVEAEVIKEIKTAESNYKLFTVNNILTKLLRLQQITSGFVKNTGDPEVELAITPKLDALVQEVISIVDAEENVVIWCRFLKSIDMIKNRLKKEKIKCITMSGNDKDKDKLWRTYQEKLDIPVFISQVQSGGVGIELFKTNSTKENQHTIFYENVWSLDWRIQAQDRIHRIGQNSTCIYKDIIIKDTIDEKILTAIKDKKKIADLIMREGSNWLKGEPNV